MKAQQAGVTNGVGRRLALRDHHDRGGLRGPQWIPGIDLQDARQAADRCGQSRVAELDAGAAARDLRGRAFLHDDDRRADNGFRGLGVTLTAPVVVASWVSHRYDGSVVVPLAFGGGNRRLCNVTGGVGMVECNGGALRIGLSL